MAEAAAEPGKDARPGLLGRIRAARPERAGDGGAEASESPTPVAESPTGYKTFSRKLAPSLIAIGGALTALGGVGAWVRASQVVSEGLAEEEVEVVMGHTYDWGLLLALLGCVVLVSSAAWLTRSLVAKIFSIVAAGAVIGISIWRLQLIDRQAAAMADAARSGAVDFLTFHAGLGWGAWCLVAGSVALGLGIVAGVLRELDVRKGLGA